MAGRREKRLIEQERSMKWLDTLTSSPKLEDLVKEYPHLDPNPDGPIYRVAYHLDTGPESTGFIKALHLYTDQDVEAPSVFRGLEIKISYQERTEANQFELMVQRSREEIEKAGGLFPGTPEWQEYMESPEGKAELEWFEDHSDREEEAESAADELDEELGASVESIKVLEAHDAFSMLVTIVPGVDKEVLGNFRGFPVRVCDPTPRWQLWRQDENGNAELIHEGLSQADAILLARDYERNWTDHTFTVQRADVRKRS